MLELRGFALLLVLQGAGELASQALQLPVPGPVVGLLLLVAASRIQALQAPLAAISRVLLDHLSLLFVPAGVGIIAHWQGLAGAGVGIGVVLALLLSTWVGLAVTAWVLRALLPREEGAE